MPYRNFQQITIHFRHTLADAAQQRQNISTFDIKDEPLLVTSNFFVIPSVSRRNALAIHRTTKV